LLLEQKPIQTQTWMFHSYMFFTLSHVYIKIKQFSTQSIELRQDLG
jgi:hypothetical protein